MIFDSSYFKTLWDAHFDWSMGILYSEILKGSSADSYLSEVSGEYYNFAVPSVLKLEGFNLKDIEKTLKEQDKKLSILLFSTHQEAGFTEYLVRNGYKSHGGDCWVVLDKDAYKDNKISTEVIEVTPDNFRDYYTVLSPVFSDFPGNEKYLDICLKSIKGELHGRYGDLVSKLFVIYDSGKAAAGAGLFYSKKANIAYLHDAGTLPEYRGKGYQSALLKYRANISLAEGITRIYSSVEPNGQSWHNCIKVGFTQTPWSMLLVKEDK